MTTSSKRPLDGKLLAGYTYDPDKLFIITDKKHPCYDSGAHDELTQEFIASISKHGIIEAIVIRKNEEGQAEVVDGRMRVRAARLVNAGRDEKDKVLVPCTFRRGDAVSAFGATVAANVHRKAPDARREQIAKAQRMANLGHDFGSIATDLGVSEKTARRLVNADPKPPAKKKRGKATNPGLKMLRECSARISKADLSPDARSILQWAAGELPTTELQREIPSLFVDG